MFFSSFVFSLGHTHTKGLSWVWEVINNPFGDKSSQKTKKSLKKIRMVAELTRNGLVWRLLLTVVLKI